MKTIHNSFWVRFFLTPAKLHKREGTRILFFSFFPLIEETSTNAPFMLQALIPSNILKLGSQWIQNSAKVGPKDIIGIL